VGLRKKQQAFVDEYLKCWNAAEAARRAGYSERTARQQGSRLLTNVDIQAAIQERLDELAMGADEVLVRLAEQARAEYAQYIVVKDGLPAFDFDACVRDGKQHLIKKIKYDKDGNPEVEFYDAQTALVQIARHHALFTDKAEHSGAVDVAIPLAMVEVVLDRDQEGRSDGLGDADK